MLEISYKDALDYLKDEKCLNTEGVKVIFKDTTEKVQFIYEFLNSDFDIVSRIEENFELFCEVVSPLEQIKDVPQNNRWHFGDVFKHTMSALSMYKGDNWIVKLALLLHDTGKKQCRTTVDGIDHFYNHAEMSLFLTRDWGISVGLDKVSRDLSPADCFNVLNELCALIEFHDYYIPTNVGGVRKLYNRIEKYGATLEDWIDMRECDVLAHNNPDELLKSVRVCRETISEFEELKKEADIFASMPINGHDIISLGYSGRDIGLVLNYCLKLFKESDCSLSREALLNKAKGYVYG